MKDKILDTLSYVLIGLAVMTFSFFATIEAANAKPCLQKSAKGTWWATFVFGTDTAVCSMIGQLRVTRDGEIRPGGIMFVQMNGGPKETYHVTGGTMLMDMSTDNDRRYCDFMVDFTIDHPVVSHFRGEVMIEHDWGPREDPEFIKGAINPGRTFAGTTEVNNGAVGIVTASRRSPATVPFNNP